MGGTYLILLTMGLASALGAEWPRIRIPGRRGPVGPIAILCALLCVSFAYQLGIVGSAARHADNLPPVASTFPIALLSAGFLYTNNLSGSDATVLEIVDVAQSAALLALAVMLLDLPAGSRVAARAVIAAGAAAMAAVAFFAPAMECPDLYSYVGLAQSGINPYHPGLVPFTGDLATVNRIWGLPMAPSPYGPLWLSLSGAVLAPLPALGMKLFALRALGAVAIGLCIALLAALRKPYVLIALIAVNPAIYQLFVAEGHNDILGVVFILAAVLVRGRAPLLAVALAACAGLVKLPYIAVAPLVFIAEPKVIRRTALAAASTALTLALSWIAGGPSYLWALHRVYTLYARPLAPLEVFLHIAVIALAVAALIGAFFFSRFIAGLSWSNLALGQFALPQYLAWCFPYAILADEPNLAFFISLPIVLFLLNIDYTITFFYNAARAVLVMWSAVLLVDAIRQYGRRRSIQKKGSAPAT